MKQLLDFIPLIFFFIVYKMEERLITLGGFEYTLGGIFSATEVLISMSILVYGGMYLKYRKLERSQLITLGAVLFFCTFTIIMRDEAILKWKAPVVYWIFSGIFFGTHYFSEKKAIQLMLEHAVTMPSEVWVRLNIAWGVFCFCLACTNLFVAFTFHEYWVDFKVFGSMGLTFIFIIGQSFYIAPYIEEDEESEAGNEAGNVGEKSSEQPAD
jgi:intracellular septation protein